MQVVFAVSNFTKVSLEGDTITFYNTDSDINSLFEIKYVGYTNPDSAQSISREGSSPSTSVEYVLSGKGYLTANGKKYSFTAGDCILMKHHSHYKLDPDETDPPEKIWICVLGTLPDILMDAYGLNGDTLISHADIKDELMQIHSIAKQNMDTAAAAPIFHSAVIKMSAALGNMPKTAGKSEISDKVYEIINKNVFGDLCLDDIAAKFFMSKVQLIRVFKHDFGVTPYRYFLMRKIDVAKELLRDTNMSVKSIGEKLSFSDEHYFSKIFKRIAGTPPGKYRKKL